MKSILQFFYRLIRQRFLRCRMRYDYHWYVRRKQAICNQVFSKPRIKVVFFVLNLGMWKNNNLVRLLMNDSRFDPYVVSFFAVEDNVEFQQACQVEMRQYFQSQNMPFVELYDFENKKWLDIKHLSPDIVFYPQPYGNGYEQYTIKALWENCLFYYIPYCIDMEKDTKLIDTLLFNISHKVFAASTFHKELWSKLLSNKGENIVMSGYPSMDYLSSNCKIKNCEWKETESPKFKIIWAPHHSILDTEVLHYSNFLSLAFEMQKLALLYSDVAQFAFKPHPRLRPKLERLQSWGKEKTDAYYSWWKNTSNTTFVDGEYYDLFLSSDALIHDCSSFMAEYLFTKKPALFVVKKGYKMPLNCYGQECLNMHYLGENISDIKRFIEEVVIGGDDGMYSRRKDFAENSMIPNGNVSVAHFIYNEICKDLKSVN